MNTASPPLIARRDDDAVSLDITGMTCAACAQRVEKALKSVPGVSDASVNLMLERAEVQLSDGVTPEALIKAVVETGYGARRRDIAVAPAPETTESEIPWPLILCAALTAPLFVQMIAMWFGVMPAITPWFELALATPVQIIGGARFYRGAVKALRAGAPNMDVLVVIGTTAAFVYSAVLVVLRGEAASGHLYFEASAVVLTLVHFGKWLEARAKRATTKSLRGLLSLRPQSAHVLRHDVERDVAVGEVLKGELVLVRPGERVPIDGTVTRGESEADESLLTGESLPVVKRVGDKAIAGSLNGSGLLTIEATAVGADTTLSQIVKLVDGLQSGRAPIQRLVDKVSGIFVPVVLVLAVLTFGGWLYFSGSLEGALSAAVAVLVIACPCALGLATPAALVAGTGAAAREGILIRDLDALESAHAIDTVVFDKTGTLTEGRPRVLEIKSIVGDPEVLLTLAAAAQQGSEHPLGKAILEEARERRYILAPLDEFRAQAGEGIVAKLRGQTIAVGNEALMQRQGIAMHADSELTRDRRTPVFVALDGQFAGTIYLADAERSTTAEAIARLHARGLSTILLSGDTQEAADVVARSAGLMRAIGRVAPSGKAEVIQELQRQGKRVAMVGDGVNDAPALAAADLGIAMGTGTDAAIGASDITLLRPDPRLVADALEIATATRRKIRQNLFWAFIYNVFGLPLAAAGLLTPAFAGAAMAMSSVSVVMNALGLSRWEPMGEAEYRAPRRWGFAARAAGIALLVLLLGPPLWVALYGLVPTPITPLMIGRWFDGAAVNKTWASFDELSPNLVNAVIAAEDTKFCGHNGFDWDAIDEARARNEKSDTVRGASTISMQTAKNAFLWPARSWFRKGVEAYFTLLVETLWSKQRIMTVYLNVAEWGDGIYGAEAASRAYFKKPASDLTEREASLLAAVLPNPREWRANPAGPYVETRSTMLVGRMHSVQAQGLSSCVQN